MKTPTLNLQAMHRDSMRNWALQHRKLQQLGDMAWAMFALMMAMKHREWAREEEAS